MMRRAPAWYEIAWRIALPVALARLWWRGRREPGYRLHVAERLGRYDAVAARWSRGASPAADAADGTNAAKTSAPNRDVPRGARAAPRPIWIHAVSVGETRAAQPLVAALMHAYPDVPIVLTHMTAAGRETGRAVFGDRVVQSYLPYDASFAVERFLGTFAPRFGLLLETELWPNLVLRARSRGVPLFLVNARLSQRSADRYARLGGLTREVLGALAGISAQTAADAHRLEALGARDVAVAGNVKFDLEVPAGNAGRGRALREWLGVERRVWMAGSTRDGEEALLLAALGRQPLPPDTLWLLVPRHPQRFEEVASLIEKAGLRVVRRSSGAAVTPSTQVVVGDTMGEMLAYYAAADVAFVGGTLLPLGGQNMIEPLAVGTPVVIGTSTFNFAEIARAAIAAGAALQAADADAAIASIGRLLADTASRTRMADAGRDLLAAHRGATMRTVEWIAARLDDAAVPPARTKVSSMPG